MNKYKLTFKLKQHTPIIHFQHNQEGATLRASELKPKLDKFLIEKLGKDKLGYDKAPNEDYNEGINEAKNKGWLISGQEKALDYKVRIIDNDSNPKNGTVVVMPPNKENWLLSKDITFELSTFNTFLKNKIENEIDLFFAVTNFGKRQNKGFGCFYPDSLKEKKLIDLLNGLSIPIYKYSTILGNPVYDENENNMTNYYDSNISKNIWNRLKSGKNHREYEKSRIFEYLEDNNLRWDKRWIKKQLKNLIKNSKLPLDLKQNKDPIDINHANSWNDSTSEEYRFGRALLGLAEHYEFLTTDSNTKYKVKVLHPEIERFKAPVIFKVFDKSIYVIFEDIEQEMFNTDFSFEVQVKKKNRTTYKFEDSGSPISISEKLSTPSSSEFKLDIFLDKYLKTVGFTKI